MRRARTSVSTPHRPCIDLSTSFFLDDMFNSPATAASPSVSLRQVPTALAALTQLTQLAYTRGFPVGGPGWERKLLAATAALTDLHSLHLASVPNRGGEVGKAH